MKTKGFGFRGLGAPFMKDLEPEGLLNPILVRVKRDSSLCLEIRQEYINVYYRGGNIMRVKKTRGCYFAYFEKKYCEGNCCKVITDMLMNPRLDSHQDVKTWVEAFPSLKQVMDFWFAKHPKEEREFQQLVLRENNGSGIGNATDYFIVDIEYDNHKGARFDLVAVEWESNGTIRKLSKGYKPKLSFIEMKYGDGAISGKAGMLEHIKDFQRYFRSDPGLKMIREEIKNIFDQKRKLRLIPALANNKNPIGEFDDKTDYIFLLAGHDPASRKLRGALKQIEDECGKNDLGFDIKFCSANFMGYGLFKQNIFTSQEFMQRFDRQV